MKKLSIALVIFLLGISIWQAVEVATFRRSQIDNLDYADYMRIKATVSVQQMSESRLPRILGIRWLDAKTIEVTTGKIAGPLNGSGRTYLLEKNEGSWKVVKMGGWMT